MSEQGYLDPVYLSSLGVVHSAVELLDLIAGYRPPPRKWGELVPERS
jgi:hypothetical protein